MIFKVQISQGRKPKMLIYNESHKYLWEGEASREMLKAVKKEPKTFWHGRHDKKTGLINLSHLAEWQDW